MAQILRFPVRGAGPRIPGGRMRAATSPYNRTRMATTTERGSPRLGPSFRLGDWLVEPSLNRIFARRRCGSDRAQGHGRPRPRPALGRAGGPASSSWMPSGRPSSSPTTRSSGGIPRAPRSPRRRRARPPLHRDHPEAPLPADRGRQLRPRRAVPSQRLCWRKLPPEGD